MKPFEKIYIAGHRGLVGSALRRRLRAAGYANIVTRDHAQLDLTNQGQVLHFFEQSRPDHVFLAAARVGGIHANNSYPAQFIYENLAIQTNVIQAAWLTGVRKLLFLGSSCIYPKLAPQPLREEYLLTAPLEASNEPYAVAKIAGIKMCAAYNRQYGTDFISVMPTNLYGQGDNYDLETSHVLPALIRKLHEAKLQGKSSVTLWGTGTPRREFMHSDDMADACVFLMEQYHARDIGEIINIGTGEDITIRELAVKIAAIVGFAGRIFFDAGMPDGTPRKLLDVSRIHGLGWHHSMELDNGIREAYRSYLASEEQELLSVA